MSGDVLIWILAVLVVLSLGFSAAAFVIQLKRKNKMEKMNENAVREQMRYTPGNVQIKQPEYSNQPVNAVQNVQPQQINNPFADDDYEEKTQSLWSSSNRPAMSNTFATNKPVSGGYNIYIDQTGTQGANRYEVNIINELTIGRAGTSGLVIADSTVSGLQCVLTAKPEGVYIENKSGSNITQLNGITLSGMNLIIPHDTIRIGKVDLTVLSVQQAM